MLLPETELAGAGAFGEKIRLAVKALPLDGGGADGLTVSVGTAALTAGASAADLVAAADAELYRAKAGGRDRVGGEPRQDL